MPKELEAHLINACGKKRRPTPRFYLAGNHWLLGGSIDSQNCTSSIIPYHLFLKKRALFPTKQKNNILTYCNMFVAIKNHGNFLQNAMPKENGLFCWFFCFGNVGWRTCHRFLHQFLMEESWGFGEIRYQKSFSAQKTKGVLPSLKHPWSKSSRKLGRIPMGNQKSIPTIHFQVLWLFEFLVSGSSCDLFDTFLCVQFTTHKRNLSCVFFLFSPGYSFLKKKHIWCIH